MTDLMSFMETMGTSDIPLVAAFFIGLMMAISPCPLATNITAIAYVSRNIGNSRYTVLVGLLYSFGRMAVYVTIAALIVLCGLNVQSIALFLQEYGDLLLGPVLLICGILMYELIPFSFALEHAGLQTLKEEIYEKLSHQGLIGSFFLGILFAISFCPFSAVLFFGMLVPLALSTRDPIGVPLSFGLATGLPVTHFSILLATEVNRCGAFLGKVQAAEIWVRRIVSVIFILVGLYFIVRLFF
ncbi:aromatic aminobenezylarsenical efflux permease ArsG family transporter [uncultured Methanospirillum sp.]|uniref:aromatic aminobenezylarsenical efflux permease ArsG family transporter n=1 Tax=uncultured Methanospirillum sp. TaxID=262503 RepID=UPI0029C854FF|nr:aromatic aminobenezylarsenical efflux permease ArsG family transporter [uncultured Methanospirillum sp.]